MYLLLQIGRDTEKGKLLYQQPGEAFSSIRVIDIDFMSTPILWLTAEGNHET
jgi:hypothetical protein